MDLFTEEELGLLCTDIEDYKEKKLIDFPSDLPNYMINNLSEKFEIRPYQERALKNFLVYMEDERLHGEKQTHLLFRMATGSGKTYCMAASILYLYQKGFRNFLFFVDDVNIIEKTKLNFTDSYNQKFLFAKEIVIEGKKVAINEVENFRHSNDDAINIKFTTIQKLASDLKKNQENTMIRSDFSKIKVAIISDEAHHMNALTKKGKKEKISSQEKDSLKSWEEAGEFVFRSNRNNLLLEFTATMDLKVENIRNKYKDKIIFNYPLLKFREDGYTKEFFNVQTDSDAIQRTLLAMLMSQYRMKLFADMKINVKPVILLKHFRNKLADDFFKVFQKYLQYDMTLSDILKLKQTENGLVLQMFQYYEAHNMMNENLVNELKYSFSKEKCIVLHSDKPEKERLKNILKVNSLEEKNNPVRLVLTVGMLHEGWDVLNLFDIVRLYDERQPKVNNNVAAATIQEAQLIGRGVRYYPFVTNNEDELKYKRKWDYELDNEKRICETLLYYSKTDSRYISELRQALKETGFEPESKTDFSYNVKLGFEMTTLYKYGKLFENKKEKIGKELVQGLPESFNKETIYYVSGNSINMYGLMDEASYKDKTNRESKRYKIKDIDQRIIYRALQKYTVFRYNRLVKYFPNLKSNKEFITSDKYYANFELEISKSGDITNNDIYQAVLISLENLSNKILNMKEQYIGTHEFYEVPIKNIVKNQIRHKINPDKEGEGVSQNSPAISNDFRLDLSQKDWFVFTDHYGTTEEKRFVKYFDSMYDQLKNKYDDVYLIRNERKLKLYSFKNGNRFEPDFILLLQKYDGANFDEQHIFIEPKGKVYRHDDKWKEEFLLELENYSQVITYVNDDSYKIVGLPFYTHNAELDKFKKTFEEKTLQDKIETFFK